MSALPTPAARDAKYPVRTVRNLFGSFLRLHVRPEATTRLFFAAPGRAA